MMMALCMSVIRVIIDFKYFDFFLCNEYFTVKFASPVMVIMKSLLMHSYVYHSWIPPGNVRPGLI